jgi:hypothetical protein
VRAKSNFLTRGIVNRTHFIIRERQLHRCCILSRLERSRCTRNRNNGLSVETHQPLQGHLRGGYLVFSRHGLKQVDQRALPIQPSP